MAGVNKVILVGRLGADPESRSLGQSGNKVVNLRLATSETWKDKASGERKERTEWHTVVIFNEGLGGIAERYLKKGSEVYIEGQLETRKWKDQSGTEKYTTEVVLRPFNGAISLIGGNGGGGGNSRDEDDRGGGRSGGNSGGGNAKSGGGGGGKSNYDLDDDIPF